MIVFRFKINQSKSLELSCKIKTLINSINKHGVLKGLGKPEVLRHYNPKAYSRRINKEDRPVYRVEENYLIILTGKGHYKD